MRNQTQEIQVACWSESEEKIRQVAAGDETEAQTSPQLRPWLFRGLGNSRWGLETTLERSYPSERCDETAKLQKYYRKILAAKPAVETFSGRRWVLPNPQEFGQILTDHWTSWLDIILGEQAEIYEYLVYLRHHGFPSPLLDWTVSPYVAALFAFDVVPENVEYVSVYAVLPSAGSGSIDQHFFLVGPYMRTHERHFLQQCWYSMCVGLAHPDHGTKDYIFRPQEPAMADDLGPIVKLLKFTIPAKERRVALQRLDLMNINPFSLFGSEESLIRTVARRECYFKKWS